MKKKHKALKISLITLGSVLFIFLGTVLGVFIYLKAYKIPKQDEKIDDPTGLVVTCNRSLYDKNGNKLELKGINAGQILLQEGWMSPFCVGAKKDSDGNYIKDKDGNLTYDEFAEETFLDAINLNSNLNDDLDNLKDYYYKSFFDENDFKIIKNELGLNTIRLPFYWRNILNDDLTRKEEDVAFKYLDWFLTNCKENDLYCVLDLHGVKGSQNGYEHSGYIIDNPTFWDNEEYIASAIDIWDYVSNHYTNVRSDLAPYIATYDILNEPQNKKVEGHTDEKCHEVFNKIYKVIRNNNDKHVITIEGCWDFTSLPKPSDYDWENIMYEYHFYNRDHDNISAEIYKAYHMLKNIGRDYNVPVLIGEFNCFEDKDAWRFTLEDWFDEFNYNWTVWNYKTTVTGWWSSSWGVYTANLNLDTSKEETKCDVSKCTKEEFISVCDKVKTKNCQKYTLYNVLMDYKNNEAKKE